MLVERSDSLSILFLLVLFLIQLRYRYSVLSVRTFLSLTFFLLIQLIISSIMMTLIWWSDMFWYDMIMILIWYAYYVSTLFGLSVRDPYFTSYGGSVTMSVDATNSMTRGWTSDVPARPFCYYYLCTLLPMRPYYLFRGVWMHPRSVICYVCAIILSVIWVRGFVLHHFWELITPLQVHEGYIWRRHTMYT